VEAHLDSTFARRTDEPYIPRKNILRRKPAIPSILRVIAGIITTRKAFTGPIKVQISPVNICNNSCLMCRSHSPLNEEKVYTKTGKKLMEMDVFVKLIEELYRMGTKEVQLSGRGEPFLHSDVFDMIKYIKSKGICCYVTTNGSLLNEESSEKLVEYKLDVLNISLNSCKEETHSIIHGE
jgi:MoaA/NifB/PqqE/SkfB family radical SAM enzyme